MHWDIFHLESQTSVHASTDSTNKDLSLWSHLNNTSGVWPSCQDKTVAFKRQHADTWGTLRAVTINFKTSRHWGIKLTLMPLTPVPFSLLLPRLFVSLVSVISNQNISSSSPETEPSPGQTHGKSARSPAVRQETSCSTRRKKNKKWVTITPLIAETVWRRADTFSRGGRCYSPLMRISYEDSAEKQRWFQGAAVVLLFTVEWNSWNQ